MTELSKPLMDTSTLTRFDLISVEHIEPAIAYHLARSEEALERAASPQTPLDYQVLTEVLDVPLQGLSGAWGVAMHLQSVKDSPELRKAVGDNQPRVTAFFSKLGADLRLFSRKKEPAETQRDKLTQAEVKALSDSLTSARLSGAELDDATNTRFKESMPHSAELSRQFSNRLQDATDQFVLYATADQLRGLPEDVLASMTLGAEADGNAGSYKVTLQQPSLGPVMQFGENRDLREQLYRTNATRASEFGPAEQDAPGGDTHPRAAPWLAVLATGLLCRAS